MAVAVVTAAAVVAAATSPAPPAAPPQPQNAAARAQHPQYAATANPIRVSVELMEKIVTTPANSTSPEG